MVPLGLLVSTQSKALSGLTFGPFGRRASTSSAPSAEDFPCTIDANPDSETNTEIAINTIEKIFRVRMFILSPGSQKLENALD
jgi:hypothetical protein